MDHGVDTPPDRHMLQPKHRAVGPGIRVPNNATRIYYTLILAKRQLNQFFFFWCGKFRVKKLIITQKPHTVFGFVCGSTQRIVGLSLSWSFPTWKRGKRDHLSTLWQKILQREQLNPWTTESTLPQTDTSPSLSWNRLPKHKSAKQCHKNLLHFDLSQKGIESILFFLFFSFNILFLFAFHNIYCIDFKHK